MKRKLQILIGIIVLTFGVLALSNILSNRTTSEIEQKKLMHEQFLANSPFKNTDGLTKMERIEQGLPPNPYIERMWELTMNPALGRPTPENLEQIRTDLQEERLAQFANRVPGDASGNDWIERGPDNVGGRSRAVIFDPNDATNETVFAGGVSGGLWKNTNISNASSVWTQVGIPENLNISAIAVDPNDPKIFYVGTGERNTASRTTVSGNGLWKSDDGGTTWADVFGGPATESQFGTNAKVTVNSPVGIAGEYIAVDSNFDFGAPLTGPVTGNLVLVNDGTANPNEGCNALINGAAVNGNIAIIYRGNCNFTDKVKNAEDAGATAVIMVNNIAGPPSTMGGDTETLTIPAVMVSKADGQLMVDELGTGVNVTMDIATSSAIPGIFTLAGNQYINDIVVRDNVGVSEVFIAAGAGGNPEGSVTTWLGLNSYGVFKSTNAGISWSEASVPLTSGGEKNEPFDLEIGADNTIWMSSINNFFEGAGGGSIFSSPDGNTFTLKHTVTDASRTQLAASATDADKIYVLAQGTGAFPVIMEKTLDGFATTTSMSLPNDADGGISAADFTRGQASYDLILKVNPTDDTKVFAGGIDLFSYTEGIDAWSQFAHWYGGFGFQEVHADQHAIAFGNGDANKMLFGNDGGVYYSNDGGTTTTARNNGFNVTQFYSVGVAPTAAVAGASLSGDYFAAGSQDNGTQYFGSAGAGINSSIESQGGDGAATMFDQDGSDTYYITNYVYNGSINKRDYATGVVTSINSETSSNGDFINQEALDSNLDLLYTNYSTGTTYRLRRYALNSTSKAELSNALLDVNPTALKVSPYTTTSTTLFVGTESGKLLKVTNAQIFHTWSDISGPDFFGSISDIEFGQNEDEIFVTMFNYGTDNVWYTSDGGTTWVAKEGDLPDLPVKAILQNPLNTEQVILGTDLGVWYTQDFSSASPKWNSAFNGMSNVIVLDLDLRDDNTVFAATYARGIFSGVFTADVLGVDDNILKDGIGIYPTVSNGEITIQSNLNLGDVKLDIYNISGQKVYSSNLELSNNTQRVNLNLSSGMYLAQFTVDNISETKKIIIK